MSSVFLKCILCYAKGFMWSRKLFTHIENPVHTVHTSVTSTHVLDAMYLLHKTSYSAGVRFSEKDHGSGANDPDRLVRLCSVGTAFTALGTLDIIGGCISVVLTVAF